MFGSVKHAVDSAVDLRLTNVDALVFRGVNQIIPVRVPLQDPTQPPATRVRA